MADVDQGQRPGIAFMVIAAWVALTFLHDACTVHFFHTSKHLTDHEYHVILPLVLTLTEVIMCLATLNFGCQYGPYLESISLVVCTHLFGAFVRNIWLETKEPEFGILGANLDPLMCLLLIFICKGSRPNMNKAISTSLLSFGLILLSTSVHTVLNTDRTVIITMLSGVFVSLRNISVTYWHEEKISILPRSARTVAAVVLSTLLVALVCMPYVSHGWIIALPLAVMTCVLHVCVTYLTCAVLLSKFSIPTICVLAAVIQFFEGQVLIASSHRPATVIATAACAVILVGLYLYTYDAETGHAFHTHKIVPINEMFTRIQFLSFLASIIGVLFYVLQPRVSQRDLHTLSFVGLDKVIRRLLSIEQPEGHEH